MTPEIVSVVLTGAGVLLGVWRIQAHYEMRNETAHAELRGAIAHLAAILEMRNETAHAELRGAIAHLAAILAKVAEDVAYLRGRQDERDRVQS